MLRYRVKPGITGLAQVVGLRGETDMAKMIERLRFDLIYVETWSLKLDLLIIASTVPRLVIERNAY
jgi:lipopolysaccharide/colanic/teichoic acid biosynthesis glycosyltransferase